MTLLPGSSFITEEGTVKQEVDDSDPIWIIDPLDGTTNFMYGLPYFSVSIALKSLGQIHLGVVYDIMHDGMYSGVLDKGAYLNGRRIAVTEESQLGESVLATGFPYVTFDKMQDYLLLFQALVKQARGIRRFGSAALDLCFVAKGSFAGYYEYGLNDWDIAAGTCIVREAGGYVTDFYGGSDFPGVKGVLATNGKIHSELQAVINTYY